MNTELAQRRPLHLHALVFGAALLVLLLASLLEVRERRYVGFPASEWVLPDLCVFQQQFGIDCPGCGLTRSFISMAEGNLRAAWQYHRVGPLLFLVVAAQLALQPWLMWRARRGHSPPTLARWLPGMLLAVSILLLGQWAWRQISLVWDRLAS